LAIRPCFEQVVRTVDGGMHRPGVPGTTEPALIVLESWSWLDA
jgi:hypothetical protein